MLPPGIEGIKLQDYVCGGYYPARTLRAGAERGLDPLLPEAYVSASSCFSDFFPDSGVSSYLGPVDGDGNLSNGIPDVEERLACAARFGISAEQLPAYVRWGQTGCGGTLGAPRGFYRLSDARRATEWITLPADAFVLFGIGLHQSLTAKFLGDTIDDAWCTVPRCVGEGRELSAGGAALGHELLNTEGGVPHHSWHCNGLAYYLSRPLPVALNRHGHLDSFEAALDYAKTINRGEIGAEPGPWYPWLIVRYE